MRKTSYCLCFRRRKFNSKNRKKNSGSTKGFWTNFWRQSGFLARLMPNTLLTLCGRGHRWVRFKMWLLASPKVIILGVLYDLCGLLAWNCYLCREMMVAAAVLLIKFFRLAIFFSQVWERLAVKQISNLAISTLLTPNLVVNCRCSWLIGSRSRDRATHVMDFG
jgi:hypothetical protein